MSEQFEVKINNRQVHQTKDNLKWIVKYCLPYMTDSDLIELKDCIVAMENHRQEIRKDASTQTYDHSGRSESPISDRKTS